MIQISLKAARVNAGMSQKEAANKANVHVQTLGKYENDSNDIPVSLLKTLASIYRIPMDCIFLGK